jgi:hypothetical protein
VGQNGATGSNVGVGVHDDLHERPQGLPLIVLRIARNDSERRCTLDRVTR